MNTSVKIKRNNTYLEMTAKEESILYNRIMNMKLKR